MAKSKYLAYTFLYDDAADLRCDFEILTDEISSMTGLLRSLVEDAHLRDELEKINELIYHINPSLRTQVKVTQTELDWLFERAQKLRDETKNIFDTFDQKHRVHFTLPQGCTAAAVSHILRSKCKALVRLLSRYEQQGNHVAAILHDFTNLFSGYFYYLALKLNKDSGCKEVEYTSRAYNV
ncbi:MAG: ATP--cob(I)alamin adenosyltransferase [Spirochaetaceae bacterium]|jgi:ATP:cob(I)alamin adenosyltransferase|nr:ATP--cob(I)alamin adenosyltransferase [Spirochaetaceae bacterium]